MSEGRPKTNIPTDLLRTLDPVDDLRSITKAAILLGLTQPAVSAQIKRLQYLLGADLFDRSVQGISLTPQGETVVTYARRLLSINDQIMHLGADDAQPEMVIRLGATSDYIAAILPNTLARFRERRPDVRFMLRTAPYDALVRDLRSGGLDLMVGLSLNPPPDAHHVMARETVWVRGVSTRVALDALVPLVSYGEESPFHRVAVNALQAVGLGWEAIFTGSSLASLASAVAAGMGVMPIARSAASDVGLIVWEDAPLPKLPDLYSGIYVCESGARATLEQLADEIAEMLYGTARRGPTLVVNKSRTANPAA
ncbi:MAG: LysR family transcriptional regulator [Pseudolabrys sp.]